VVQKVENQLFVTAALSESWHF